MIDKIEINNFKCIKKTEIDIRPVTILIGPNGSGKSNILQFMMLMKQSFRNKQLVMKGNQGDFISIKDISFYQQTGINISNRFTGHINFKNTLIAADGSDLTLKYSIHNLFDKEKLAHQTTTIYFNDEEMRIESGSYVNNPKFHRNFNFLNSGKIVGGRITANEIGELSSNMQQDVLEEVLSFKSVIESINTEFDRVLFIPAIRGVIHPFVSLGDYPASEFTSFTTISQQNQSLFSTLAYKPEIGKYISKWTEKIIGVPIEGKLATGKQVSVLTTGKIPINIIHEGSGLNQLLLLLSQLYITPEESILGMEEPEIHLHPKAQSELVKVIYEAIKEKQLRTIITTHSEHILFAFLTKVAEGELNHADITIYYFEKTDQGSKITDLNVSPQGTVDGGLPGFFDANITAYKRYIDAISKNQLKGSE